MGQTSSALDFSTGYKVARSLQLKLLPEINPGRLFGEEVGVPFAGGPELCYLFSTEI